MAVSDAGTANAATEVLLMEKHILIVEDEPQIREVVSAYLEREGFVTVLCGTVHDALAELDRERPDLMLLDITLPDGSGLDLLRCAQADRIPAIMLTARAEEIDRIVGLELGADDYVAKPFSPREIVARVRAVLRRVEERPAPGAPTRCLRIEGLDIDLDAHEVRVRGEPVLLTPSEFRILTLLAEHPGQALTRSQILDQLHDDGSIFERTLDRHINNLRKKIEVDPSQPAFVLTVYGVGYKMRKP